MGSRPVPPAKHVLHDLRRRFEAQAGVLQLEADLADLATGVVDDRWELEEPPSLTALGSIRSGGGMGHYLGAS